MATVYSKTLWAAFYSGGAPPIGPIVPAGFKWVVREIVITNFQSTGKPLGFAGLGTQDLGFIWYIDRARLRAQCSLRWSGRFVLDAGDALNVDFEDILWQFIFSGYELTIT